MTALMVAAQEGRADMVRLLLENGADPEAKNIFGQSALALAELKERAEIADILKTHWEAGTGE
jgi:ankyrin repeat protein